MSAGATPPQRSPVAAMLLGGSVTVVSALPVFLTGALAVQLTEDLAFGLAALGFAVGLYRAASALASPFLGNLADRIGASWAMRLAALLALASTLGIGVVARNFLALAFFLVLGGCANALGQPAANRLLVNIVPPGQLGFAFGLKQSALPAASVLSGLSVPLIALTLGWRWAFIIAAGLAAIVILAIGRPTAPSRRPERSADTDQRGSDRTTILMLAVAMGLATGAQTSPTAFYVESAVRAGSSASVAGTILALASATAIVTRLIAGRICDLIDNGHLRICGGMLVTGSIGMLLLSSGQVNLMTFGAFLTLGVGWGFNGVFWFALVRVNRDSPGRATGSVAPGGLIGGSLGPFIFGAIAQNAGYASAWTFVAVVGMVAACGMFLASQRLASTAAGRASEN